MRARVGQGSAGEQLARFAVVDWGEVLRGGLEEICFVPERGRSVLGQGLICPALLQVTGSDL